MAEPVAARVGIVMGSDSDWPVMKPAAEALAEFDIAYEADVVVRAPDARGDARVRPLGRRPRAVGDHRRRRRCGPPARHARGGHAAAGDRRTGAAEVPRRHGLAALDRADAGRRPGRDGRHRRRPQRRPARRTHPRRDRPRAAGADARLPGRAQGDRPGEGRRSSATTPVRAASGSEHGVVDHDTS